MSNQIDFPFPDDQMPPEKKRSQNDEIIDHLFQVLPAMSLNDIHEKLKKRGFVVSRSAVKNAIAHLRDNAHEYQWTIPHVHTHCTEAQKYFAILIEKDRTFHTDPSYREHLADGTSSIVKRLSTESRNQCVMLRAAADATYLTKNIREELKDMADECSSIHNKARRVLRYLKSNNG
jgi:hypothetical protein